MLTTMRWRLAQLPLHGAQLGNIFGDDFEGPGGIEDREHAHVEADGRDSSIAPPPFGFGALHFPMLAARGHERGMLFGEAEDVPQQIEFMQLFGSLAAQNG